MKDLNFRVAGACGGRTNAVAGGPQSSGKCVGSGGWDLTLSKDAPSCQ